MNDEQVPNVEEIKERLKIEIPVEEETPRKEGGPEPSVSDMLRDLGKQFADTVRTAWESEERREVEQEIREGVNHFVTEIGKAFDEVKGSPAGQRAQTEAGNLKTNIESGDLAQKAQKSAAQGLQWLSQELGKLADQFTPPAEEEKSEAE